MTTRCSCFGDHTTPRSSFLKAPQATARLRRPFQRRAPETSGLDPWAAYGLPILRELPRAIISDDNVDDTDACMMWTLESQDITQGEPPEGVIY